METAVLAEGTTELNFIYSLEPFSKVKLPKYDKFGEKRGDEIVRGRLAHPTKSQETTYVLEKFDGSHFAIYVASSSSSTNTYRFCYATGSKLLEHEGSVLFGDPAFYKPYLPYLVKLLGQLEGSEFISVYCEVYGTSVLRRVDYGVEIDLIAYAIYTRSKGKGGFLDFEDCLAHFERSGIPHVRPSFKGTFEAAFNESQTSRNRQRGSTGIEGNMLTLAKSGLRIKHKSDYFTALESKSAEVLAKEEQADQEEKEVAQFMTTGTYYSVLSRLGNDYAVSSPGHRKLRFALKQEMAKDAYKTYLEETESLESRGEDNPQLTLGRDDAHSEVTVPKKMMSLLIREADRVLTAVAKEAGGGEPKSS